jgi:TAK1-binding protein 1
MPRSEHPNEDRHFKLELVGENFKVYGVFDGHDGPRAAGYASNYFMEYFNSDSWKTLVRLPSQVRREQIPMALREFFKAAEKEFFNSIRPAIEERKQLQRTIPSDMNSYQAYLTYPVEVDRLQELEPKISGGTTVVLAVVCENTLYIANTGDSRAVLVNENEKGLQQIVQLSVDHGVENLDELKRLMDLGLDRNQLQRSGRLGSHENTRSIGDYSIKEGYKDVDTLR